MKQYKFLDEKKKHVHTLDGQPLYGTSTVVGILAKPLTWWASGMACEKFGWVSDKKNAPEDVKRAAKEGYERVLSLSLSEYEKLLTEAYKAHNQKKNDSAEAGTDMHAELEKYVLRCIKLEEISLPLESDTDAVKVFAAWAQINVLEFLFAEAHTFSEKMWVGGIVDVGARMKNGRVALLDFKSSKEAYYSQMVQIAGYALQIEESGTFDTAGNQIMPPMKVEELIVVPFGSEKLTPRAAQNVEGFKSAFIGALENYKLSKAFEE